MVIYRGFLGLFYKLCSTKSIMEQLYKKTGVCGVAL
jgi:hypothetical protein